MWSLKELFLLLSVAFIFNWLGFCLSFCITNTIAGRYGAICGFGLSLIKWILIVRVSVLIASITFVSKIKIHKISFVVHKCSFYVYELNYFETYS